MHGDHVFGIFGLLSSLGMMGRKADLNIYGPAEIEGMLLSHLEYFGPLPYKLCFHKAAHGEVVFEDGKTEVTAIALLHRAETYGYLFREKNKLLNLDKNKITKYKIGIEDMAKIKNGADHVMEDGTVIPNSKLTMKPWHPRSYAYISDTSFKASIAEHIKDVDLLFHEATFLEEDKELAKKTLHSTARQAGEMAKKAGAGKLLIGHFSSRYKNDEEFLQEAKEVFGETMSVNDGDVFSIPLKRVE